MVRGDEVWRGRQRELAVRAGRARLTLNGGRVGPQGKTVAHGLGCKNISVHSSNGARKPTDRAEAARAPFLPPLMVLEQTASWRSWPHQDGANHCRGMPLLKPTGLSGLLRLC